MSTPASNELIVPVALDQGLDTTAPPLMAKPGTLIGCLNYEMTNHVGYRRIDGYEAYDGWQNGEIVDYYTVAVSSVTANLTTALAVGATIFTAASGTASQAIATVVAYSGTSTSGTLTYVPANKSEPVIISGQGLAMTYSTTGVIPTFTASAIAQSGLATHSASVFVANVRSYSTILRNMVTTMGTPIAGLHWFRNNLIVALDCLTLTYVDSTTKNSVQEGYTISYLGNLYLVVNKAVSGNNVTLQLEPKGTITSSPNINVVGQSDVTIATLAASSISLTTGASTNAYLISANNISTNVARGVTKFNRSVIVKFTGGVAAAEANLIAGGLVSVGASSAQYSNVYVKNVVVTSGAFSTNDADGFVEVILLSTGGAGSPNYIDTSMNIRSFGGGVLYATTSSVTLTKIAGTSALRNTNTRYQWETYNFYGQEDRTEAYATTGAGRAFWARSYVDPLTRPPPLGVASADTDTNFSYGNIVTEFNTPTLDMPKYISRLSGSLALGFGGGAVMLSVVGEPRNFDGFNGAVEIDTGDALTGLLEVQGSSLIAFGRRSIHRLAGALPDVSLETVSGNSGAYDYTAVLVGATPVFTGPSGISTLDQTAAYGDFQGRRLSYQISQTLNPKLAPGTSTTALGGCIMAMPVRGKDQYRLWLSTGEVYSMTLTEDGSKITKSNYGIGDDLRVPFAWTSEIGDSGREHMMVAWDATLATLNVSVNGVSSTIPNSKAIYKLDTGWGFNGVTFAHYFDLAHIFNPDNNSYLGIPKIRLHGYGYGLATLDVKSAGIEGDFDQAYHSAVQDISMPRTLTTFYRSMQPVTSIVDQANWGLGVKLRFQGTQAESLTTTEPSHVCQVLILHLNKEGVTDA